MSNTGQVVLTVVGTVVGAYLGYPQLGFALGSLAGSVLFPTQGPDGPRITDMHTTTSAVGTPVPIIFGTYAVAGVVNWLGRIVQSSHDQSSKGGPHQTVYTYTQSIAIGLCEGPISGLSRVWENGSLVYDVRPQQVGETDDAYAVRATTSASYAATFTLYLGDETQLADPAIELEQGAGNVPAFRGLAYIVYPERQLTETQALRHPNFLFEVFAGTFDCETVTDYANEVLYPWASSGEPMNPANKHSVTVSTDGSIYPDNPNSGVPPGGPFTSLLDALAAIDIKRGKGMSTNYLGYGVSPGGTPSGATTDIGAPTVVAFDAVTISRYYNAVGASQGTQAQGIGTTPSSAIQLYKDMNAYGMAVGKTVNSNNGFNDPSYGFGRSGVYKGVPLANGSDFPPLDSSYDISITGAPLGAGGIGIALYLAHNAEVSVKRVTQPPPNPCAGLSHPRPGYCVVGNYYVEDVDWTYDNSTTYKVLQPYQEAVVAFPVTGTVSVVSKYPLDPTRPTGHPQYNDATFWTDAYNAAVTAGTMAGGLTYGVDYPTVQAWGYKKTGRRCTASGSTIPLSQIVAPLCARVGLTDVDVSDLTTITVNGYGLGSVMTARDAIAPLRQVGFFDVVESDGALKFPTRGKANVATLTADDYGAYDGATAQPPPSVTTVKSQDVDLPRSIRVHYVSPARDYQPGEQLSPHRLTSGAVNDIDVQVAVALPDDQAAQIAEIIWADAWAGRWAHTLAVDQAWSTLEPGDCFEITLDGATRRLRIIDIADTDGTLRKLDCVRDDTGSYVSHAVSEAPAHVAPTLTGIAPSALLLLDLPALRDSDNDAGIYGAAYRDASALGWTGAAIYRSSDGGASFAPIGSTSIEAVAGPLAAHVPAAAPYVFDDVNEILVDIPAAQSLESRTDAAVLAGANAAALGHDGRWEIVQFATATKLTATRWQLSRLLRGRRGTERYSGTNVVGDKFVLISNGALARLPLELAARGADRVYKVVTSGAPYSSGTDQHFTGHAVALVPFSPVGVGFEIVTDGDALLSWTRRGRLGQELPSGTDIALSETSERYEVDIYDGPDFATVVRTLTTTTPHVLYTLAEQGHDFGSPHAGTAFYFAVHQISEAVGRGAPGWHPPRG